MWTLRPRKKNAEMSLGTAGKSACATLYTSCMSVARIAAGSSAGTAINMKVLLQRSGVARQTIHFYLRKGLLPRPLRTSRTYALYSPETVDLLNIIKECQTTLRLSLYEIGETFLRAKYDLVRIREELETRGASALHPPAQSAAGMRRLSKDELLASLDSAPPIGWLDDLRRHGLIRIRGDRFPADTVQLVTQIWELSKLGVKLESLKQIAEQVDSQAENQVSAFRRVVDSRDYLSAIKAFDALDRFAHWSRRDALRACFVAKAYRSAEIFVGPNQKHVFPSETFLAKMGLNREIDRLLNVLDRDPDNWKALTNLSRAYYLRSDWLNLYGVCQKILEIDSFNARAIADMSRALYYLGRVEDSIALLERRLRAGSDPLLKFRLGQILLLRAKTEGVPELLDAVVRKHQLASEALREAREPGVRRWILLDLALDNLSVSDPLQLNQPTIQELEELNREYQSIAGKGLPILSRISLAMGKMLAAYALYLIYRRHRDPKTEKLRRKIIQMDPHGALATRTPKSRKSA
jgi:DNA-binding transcriptional MerR regulator